MSEKGMTTAKLYEYLLSNIREEEAMTTSDNIAYLPGGFAPIGQKLKKMAKKKKRWGMRYFPNLEVVNVLFENELKVVVKQDDWGYFLEESFGTGIITMERDGEVEIHPELNERLEGTHKAKMLVDKIVSIIEKLRAYTIIANDTTIMFERKFKVKRYIEDNENVFIPLVAKPLLKEAVNKAFERSRLKYIRGALELLENQLNEGRYLGTHPILSKYKYFIGYSVVGERNKVEVLFESYINFLGNVRESIKIKDKDIVEKVVSNTDLIVYGETIVPKNKSFTNKEMYELINIIDEE